jgi:hypothetical protein
MLNNVAIPTKYPKYFNVLFFLIFILLRKEYTKECLYQKENQKEELETKKQFP